jgi:large subunit ribosomal protein L13
MPSFKRVHHTLDAAGLSPGRLASQVAILLMGKHKATFAPEMDQGDFVLVEHAAKMNIPEKKAAQKKYYSHSGYAGGLKVQSMATVFAQDPSKVLRLAVSRMLPKNTHRITRLKRLKITP